MLQCRGFYLSLLQHYIFSASHGIVIHNEKNCEVAKHNLFFKLPKSTYGGGKSKYFTSSSF